MPGSTVNEPGLCEVCLEVMDSGKDKVMIIDVKFTDDELKELASVITIVRIQQENKIENLYDVKLKDSLAIDTAMRIVRVLSKLQDKIELAENLVKES